MEEFGKQSEDGRRKKKEGGRKRNVNTAKDTRAPIHIEKGTRTSASRGDNICCDGRQSASPSYLQLCGSSGRATEIVPEASV